MSQKTRNYIYTLFLFISSFSALFTNVLLAKEEKKDTTKEEEPLQLGPQGAVQSFLEACLIRDYKTAGQYIDIKPQKVSFELNVKEFCWFGLKYLGTQEIELIPKQISAKEAIFRISSMPEPNQLIRKIENQGNRQEPQIVKWLFSSDTFDTLNKNHLKQGPLLSFLLKEWDSFLGKLHPWQYNLWKWFSIPVSVLICLLISLFIIETFQIIYKLILRKRFPGIYLLLEDIKTSLIITFSFLLLELFVPFSYRSSLTFETYILNGITIFQSIGIFWMGWKFIESVYRKIRLSHWIQSHQQAVSLLPLGKRFIRILLVLLTGVYLLQNFGYQVTSLVAGLGISGVLVALAAQKTIEQLFSGVMIGLDQAFRIGDTIKVGDMQGVVEKVGLRSTRIRTLDRTQVTIPNIKLTENTIETLTTKDKTRYYSVVRLHTKSREESIHSFVKQVRNWIQAQPKVWKEDIRVYVGTFTDSCIEIEIMFWVNSVETHEYLWIRQQTSLFILEILHKEQLEFGPPKGISFGQTIKS